MSRPSCTSENCSEEPGYFLCYACTIDLPPTTMTPADFTPTDFTPVDDQKTDPAPAHAVTVPPTGPAGKLVMVQCYSCTAAECVPWPDVTCNCSEPGCTVPVFVCQRCRATGASRCYAHANRQHICLSRCVASETGCINRAPVKCPRCKNTVKRLTVQKDGPNRNRCFYTCNPCSFFKWADRGS